MLHRPDSTDPLRKSVMSGAPIPTRRRSRAAACRDRAAPLLPASARERPRERNPARGCCGGPRRSARRGRTGAPARADPGAPRAGGSPGAAALRGGPWARPRASRGRGTGVTLRAFRPRVADPAARSGRAGRGPRASPAAGDGRRQRRRCVRAPPRSSPVPLQGGALRGVQPAARARPRPAPGRSRPGPSTARMRRCASRIATSRART
jgi:hypothetical protein